MSEWKSEFYDKYVSSGQAVDRTQRLALADFPYYRALIEAHVPPDKTIRIADLACGNGTLLFCLNALGYHNTQGVDISAEQVAAAHEQGVANVSQGDLAPFLAAQTEPLALIFLMDILEHLERGELLTLMEQVYAALAPNGRVIIHVPNGEGLFGMRIRFGDLTHEQAFTPRSISQLLRVVGFRTVESYEDKPLRHNNKGWVRALLWESTTLLPRLMLMAETGERRFILSQNMVTVGVK